jgi:hypothetical protein
MKPLLTGLEDACNEPLAPDPQDERTIMKDDFMLPENRPLDYRISTTAEDEFECDECCSTRYQLRDGIPSLGIQPYILCLDCGWQRLTTDTEEAIAVNEPVGIQRKRTKGWKMPPNTLNVTRPGEWGNPHTVTYKGVDYGKYAQQAVDRFERDLTDGTILDKQGKPLIDRISELKGKNLACFCAIGQPCHRDVLLRLANAAIASVGGVG